MIFQPCKIHFYKKNVTTVIKKCIEIDLCIYNNTPTPSLSSRYQLLFPILQFFVQVTQTCLYVMTFFSYAIRCWRVTSRGRTPDKKRFNFYGKKTVSGKCDRRITLEEEYLFSNTNNRIIQNCTQREAQNISQFQRGQMFLRWWHTGKW